MKTIQNGYHYKFQLQPLPYAYDDLQPYIDEKTMRVHHSGHLKTYVDNLNPVLEQYPMYHTWSLEELIYRVEELPQEIRQPIKNNAGGVYNHNFFFSLLSPIHHQHPIGSLGAKIDSQFGSYDTFKKQFKEKALKVFGSGYTWLVLNRDKSLGIVNTANQDTTLTMNLCPILNLDVWEHAYYLKHQNRRTDYIDDWFEVIDWGKALQYYQLCMQMYSR